jgi:hypothetical protein
MTDLLEQQLRERLRDVGEQVPAELDAPVDLEVRVARFRRRRANQRRAKLLGVAAVLTGAVALAAVVVNSRDDRAVVVAGHDQVLHAGSLKPNVVMLDARGRYVVALDARGHQVDTLVSTREGSSIVDAQTTGDHRTLWYRATDSDSAGCGRVVRADIGTGSTELVAEARAFAISPDGERLALSDSGCAPGAHEVTVKSLTTEDQTTWSRLHGAIDELRWSPDGAHLVGHDTGRRGWRVFERGNAAPLFGPGDGASFAPDGSLYTVVRSTSGQTIRRYDASSWRSMDPEVTISRTWNSLSVAATATGLFVVAQPSGGSVGLYRLGPHEPAFVRSFEYGELTPVLARG